VYRQLRNKQKIIIAQLQNELICFGQLCVQAGALANPTKATITWFSLNNFIVKDSTPIVKFCSEVLKRTHVRKYIGVAFDRSLIFAVHIDQVVMKARKELSAMKVMAAANCE
jgi:hypothetical protein